MVGMIHFHALSRRPVELRAEEAKVIGQVLCSGEYILGREVEQFEAAWAQFCKVQGCVGVANGLDALEIGLRALGIGRGDEVITTPMTAFATVLAILRAGAIPVFADIDDSSALIDMESASRCVTPRTRAVIVVHLYGRMCDLQQWIMFCSAHGIVLIEDCAQSHGARHGGLVAGAGGVFGGYSYYPTKNLGAVGDAGALVSNDPEVLERARMIRNYGQAGRYDHRIAGMNSRLDEVHAALLNVRLKWLDTFTERRREIAATYRESINNPLVRVLEQTSNGSSHVYHLFVITCEERDQLVQHLARRGVETLVHYPIPAHQQAPASTCARDPLGLPRAERHARSCVSLPCNPFLSDQEVLSVIEAVNGFQPSSGRRR
jgi:dTDP-4-amino-4,6-dideoxygalactose transaminase